MAPFGVRLVLSLAVVALAWRAYGQDDFSLEDAFDDIPTQKPKPAPKPPKIPTHNVDDFDLTDFFDATQPPKVVPKRPTKKPDVFIPTRKPRVTPKPPKKQGYDDFNLEDALDGRNDPKGAGSTINDNDKSQGGRNAGKGFDDSDLEGVVNGGYKPDKGKGGSPGGRAADNENYDNSGNLAETGTIAGIASALVMALVGAVSSYISYQQKKFCFSIQQGLNAEYVKGENMENVMTEEPQVKYSALEPQSAAAPTGDPSKV
ncbi:CD99 antigen-like protein 2 isoform X1 [Bufo bufo]|uniref:CD99 antigen-like protein 2 isoform X1 n=1 Tax=Bufo bufo TaxID=8384 RepID=UPI001ABE483F|nr:CD99 antigen-like protein 2 isoform X1 [Bufo bufo]